MAQTGLDCNRERYKRKGLERGYGQTEGSILELNRRDPKEPEPEPVQSVARPKWN
jgi:hypothetical protein